MKIICKWCKQEKEVDRPRIYCSKYCADKACHSTPEYKAKKKLIMQKYW